MHVVNSPVAFRHYRKPCKSRCGGEDALEISAARQPLPHSHGLCNAHRNLGALIPAWAGAKPLLRCFTPAPRSEVRLPAFQLRKSAQRAPRSPPRTPSRLLPVAAWASKGVSAEPCAQPLGHIPTVDMGAAWPRPFSDPWETSCSLPRRAALGSPGVPAIPPACSKPSVTQVACEWGRAVLPFPHVPAPPLPACPQPADPPAYSSSSAGKKPSFLSGGIWGGRTFLPEPGQSCPPSRRPWPPSSSRRGRGAGAPSLQQQTSSRIPQPLTATKRLPRVREDGETAGRPQWVQPRDARGGKAGPGAPTGHTCLQRPGANGSCG